ncbi:MAG: hypothetical protein V2J24_23655 [Pseudomonadales bacterium]|jgi:hypothetical protein|nr:hypothetical protein [Pseudomonadales bacterium]
MPLTKLPTLEFGDWLPDLGLHENPGTPEAKNVVPVPRGFASLSSPEAIYGALDAPCVGGYWSLDESGSRFNFGADATQLYRLNNVTGAMDNVSRVGNYTSTGSWDFARFGSRVLAVSPDNDTQYFDTEASTLFADLPGSPPRGRTIGVVRDFIMVGRINDGGDKFDTVAWSGFNNSEIWGTNYSAQSDQQTLPGRSGEVQRIVPGQVGRILTENSLWVATYIGPPQVFRFDEVVRNSGTPAWRSVCWASGLIFFLGHEGFMVWDGGAAPPRQLGANRVDQWFRDNLAADSERLVIGAVDRRNTLAYWAFPSSSSGTLDRVIIYNWSQDRWSYGEMTTQFLVEYAPPGFNLDTIDSLLPGGIDANSFNMDSGAFRGQDLGLAVYTSSNALGGLTGPALAAEIHTREFDTGSFRNRMIVTEVESLIEGSPATVRASVGTRERQGDNVAFSAAVERNAIGAHACRASGRFLRARLQTTGPFKLARGVRLVGREKGRR